MSTASGELPQPPARDTEKSVPDYASAPNPPTNFFFADFTLRLFLFATTVTAVVVLVTSNQTGRIRNPTGGSSFKRGTVKFNQSPAFIYLVSALAVTGFYSIITAVTSARAVKNPSPSTKFLFNLVVIDALLAGVMASATGAAGAVAYIGWRGNSHVRWTKFCNVYGRFCQQVGSSTILSLIASITLVVLVFLSAYSLYRRSR